MLSLSVVQNTYLDTPMTAKLDSSEISAKLDSEISFHL